MPIQGRRGERLSGLTEIEGVMVRMRERDEGGEGKEASRGQLPQAVKEESENKMEAGGRGPAWVER